MSRPYFETEVVRVRKEKKYCELHGTPICPDICCEKFWNCEIVETVHNSKIGLHHHCPTINSNVVSKLKEKPKGNWVNGENLDRIKFPCFCRFETGMRDYKRLGELDLINYYALTFFRLRELVQIDRKLVYKCEFYRPTLEDMIKTFDIHILKGKIIIFEEEK